MPYHYTYYSYEEFGRGYIGSRTCRCNPEQDITYFGSYTDKNFHPTQKVILEVHNTSKESLEAETALHLFYDVANNLHFANKQCNFNTSAVRGEAHPLYGKTLPPHTEEHNKKISEGCKRAHANLSPEARERMLAGNRKANSNRVQTEETKQKIRDKATGRTHSKETKEKMSKTRTGKTHSPETKAKMKAVLTGRVFTEEWKVKLSKAASKPHGRKMSEAHKKAMQEGKRRAKEARLNNNKD